MRYLNMSIILVLAQQGKIYLCQSVLGFLEPFAGYCFRKRVYFPLPWVFFFRFFFFFPNCPFFPLPLPVLPVPTSLALLRAAGLSPGSSRQRFLFHRSSASGVPCARHEMLFLLVH